MTLAESIQSVVAVNSEHKFGIATNILVDMAQVQE